MIQTPYEILSLPGALLSAQLLEPEEYDTQPLLSNMRFESIVGRLQKFQKASW